MNVRTGKGFSRLYTSVFPRLFQWNVEDNKWIESCRLIRMGFCPLPFILHVKKTRVGLFFFKLSNMSSFFFIGSKKSPNHYIIRFSSNINVHMENLAHVFYVDLLGYFYFIWLLISRAVCFVFLLFLYLVLPH